MANHTLHRYTLVSEHTDAHRCTHTQTDLSTKACIHPFNHLHSQNAPTHAHTSTLTHTHTHSKLDSALNGKNTHTHQYSTISPQHKQHSSRLYHKHTRDYIRPFSQIHTSSFSCHKGPHTHTHTLCPLTCLWQPSTMMSFCWGEVRANTISVWFLSRSSRYSALISFRSEPCTTQALASLGSTHKNADTPTHN